MTTLEIRYRKAIARIGYARIFYLPKPVKEVLQNTRDLETKVKMLEVTANNI